LDKLAAEKRAQAAAASGSGKIDPPNKRVKREADEDIDDVATSGGVFKG
jgi:hypothetical protein